MINFISNRYSCSTTRTFSHAVAPIKGSKEVNQDRTNQHDKADPDREARLAREGMDRLMAMEARYRAQHNI